MRPEIHRIAVAASKPKPRLDANDLIHLRPYVEGFVRQSWLAEQFALLDVWTARDSDSDPVLVARTLHRPDGFNMLAAAVWATRWWESERANDPSFPAPPGALRLLPIAVDLAVLELHAGSDLTAKARKYVRQRMEAGEQLWGFLHEIATFGDFIRRGATVTPHFLSHSSRQEITVHWHGIDVPVQCKVKPPGSGRELAIDTFNTFAGSIAKDLRRIGAQVIVRIGSTGDIEGEDAQFLRDCVLKLFRERDGGPLLVCHQRRVFTVRVHPIVARIESLVHAQEFLRAYGFHAGFIATEPNRHTGHHEVVAVVGLESAPTETPWRALEKSIDRAAEQLEGGPPGIAAIHYVDPTPDFEVLRRPDMPTVGSFCMSLIHEHQHVGAVMLSTDPDLQLPTYGGEASLVRTFVKPGALRDFPLGERVP